MVVVGDGKRLAVECDGERFHGLEKLQEDIERQAILERLGWRFVRIRGSIFFRDEERAMQSVFQRLNELGVSADLQLCSSGSKSTNDAAMHKVIRRAQELRALWQEERQRAKEISQPRF